MKITDARFSLQKDAMMFFYVEPPETSILSLGGSWATIIGVIAAVIGLWLVWKQIGLVWKQIESVIPYEKPRC